MMIHIQVAEALNTSWITEYAILFHLVSAGVKAERAAKQSKSAETALVWCISAKWHFPFFQILQRNIQQLNNWSFSLLMVFLHHTIWQVWKTILKGSSMKKILNAS